MLNCYFFTIFSSTFRTNIINNTNITTYRASIHRMIDGAITNTSILHVKNNILECFWVFCQVTITLNISYMPMLLLFRERFGLSLQSFNKNCPALRKVSYSFLLICSRDFNESSGIDILVSTASISDTYLKIWQKAVLRFPLHT